MIGSWITLADPAISEMLSRIGFDWICVDMQHSMLSDADMQNHIRNLRGDTKAYVRVKTNDVVEIGKALDAGAHGIIVPQVMRPDDARAAVYSTRPPVRSTGLWRSRGYGMDYPHTPAKVIVQIEHIQSVEKIESIVAVPSSLCSTIKDISNSSVLGIFLLQPPFGHRNLHSVVNVTYWREIRAYDRHTTFSDPPPRLNIVTTTQNCVFPESP